MLLVSWLSLSFNSRPDPLRVGTDAGKFLFIGPWMLDRARDASGVGRSLTCLPSTYSSLDVERWIRRLRRFHI